MMKLQKNKEEMEKIENFSERSERCKVRDCCFVGIFSEQSERCQKNGGWADGNIICGNRGNEERGYDKKERKRKYFEESEYVIMVIDCGIGFLDFLVSEANVGRNWVCGFMDIGFIVKVFVFWNFQ